MPKLTIVEGQTARNPQTGQRIVYQGGKWYPYNEATGTADIPGGGAVKLTEDQGKAQTYARLMDEAERQYGAAEAEGFDYGNPVNAIADALESPLPLVGAPLGRLAPVIRSDQADKAVAARRAWLDAQLKAMTGAGQSSSEMTENPKTYFPQFGEGRGAAGNKRQMRATAYDAARRRAGPAGSDLPEYGGAPKSKAKPPGWTQNLPPRQLAAAKMFKGAKAAAGSRQNPFVPESLEEFKGIPAGAWVIDDDGTLFQKAAR